MNLLYKCNGGGGGNGGGNGGGGGGGGGGGINEGFALDIAILLLITACDGYVGIGRTESWAGLQILPLQLAYLQGEGPA